MTDHQTPSAKTAAPATQSPAAQAELAKSKEQHDRILAEHKEREKWMPTPTQEENDAAATGQHVIEKKPDGSPVELTPDEQRQKQMEAGGTKKPYTTRAASA